MKQKNSKNILFTIAICLIVLVVGAVVGSSIYRGDQKRVDDKNEKQTAMRSTPRIDLVENSNHIKSASKYAYNAKDISAYIQPKNLPTAKQNKDNKKVVFLTFDDGPNRKITPQILDILKKKQVPATFFVVGKYVTDETKDILERELMEGHAIAMHSYTHNYKKLYPGRIANVNEIVSEAKETQIALQKQLGPKFKSTVWRYPGGHMSWKQLAEADKKLSNEGIHWIDWNSLSGDAEPKKVRPTTVEGFVKYTNTSLEYFHEKNYVVILCHDAMDKQGTADALAKIIDNFKDKGYEFGILS